MSKIYEMSFKNNSGNLETLYPCTSISAIVDHKVLKIKATDGTVKSFSGGADVDLSSGVYYAATAGSANTATTATTANQISRTFASSGTIAQTNLISVSGTTDGYKLAVKADSSDNLEVQHILTDDVSTKEVWYGNSTAMMTLQPVGSGTTITGGNLTVNGTITATAFSGNATSATTTTNVGTLTNNDTGTNNHVKFTIGDKSFEKTINNVANATYATSAGSASTATKATQDASGNVITSTYATKSSLSAVATSGKYSDLSGTPTIPTKLSEFTDDLGSSPTHTHSQYLTSSAIGNGTITITQNGTSKGTFTLNQSGNTTIALTDTNTDTNTHYTNSLTIQGNGTSATVFSQDTNKTLNIKGSGATSVSAADGVITISSTDTNTWRGIQNNLTSTSTSDSLSAYQGKVLNDKFGSYVPTSRTISGLDLKDDITTSELLASLGLTSAVKFIGTTTTTISDGSTTTSVVIGSNTVSVTSGNIVIYGNKEFLFNGTAWEELGDESEHSLSLTTGGTATMSLASNTAYTLKVGTHSVIFKTPVDNNTTYGNATTTTSGLMSSSDKSKLDGIASGANNYTLPVASSTALGGVKIGYTTTNKNYAVQLDSSNKMFVNVPWTDTNTDTHLTNSLTIKGGGTAATVYTQNADKTLNIVGSGATTVSAVDGTITISSTDTNTTYLAGTGLSLSGTTFSVKTGYTSSGKNYGVKADTSGNLYVNVPWTDTNTTYSAGTGIAISNNAISLDSDYITTKDITVTYADNTTATWTVFAKNNS